MEDEFQIKEIYGSKRNLLKVAKDSVCFSLEINARGALYPKFQNFDGYIPKDEIPKLRDELWRIIVSPLELVVETTEESFVPVQLIPAEIKRSREGFSSFSPNLYEECSNLMVKDFLMLLYNECCEAEYKKRDLDVREKLNHFGIST